MLVKKISSEFHLCEWKQILHSSSVQQNLLSYEKWTYSIENALLNSGSKSLLKGLVWLQCRHLEKRRRREGLWPGNTWSSMLHVPPSIAGDSHYLYNLPTPAQGGQGETEWSECRIILASSRIMAVCYQNKKRHLVLSKDDNIWKIINCNNHYTPASLSFRHLALKLL